MKHVSANKLNKLWKDGILPALLGKIDRTKVLTTMEQVEANTNAENIASALVIGQLNNNLGGLKFVQDEEGNWGYIPSGADTVIPFNNFNNIKLASLFSYGTTSGGQTLTTKTVSVPNITNYKLLLAQLGEPMGDYSAPVVTVNDFKANPISIDAGTYKITYTYVTDTSIKVTYLIGDSRHARLYGISL